MKINEIFGFNKEKKADKKAEAARERVRAKEKKKSDDAKAAKAKKEQDAGTLSAIEAGNKKRANSTVKNTAKRNLTSD